MILMLFGSFLKKEKLILQQLDYLIIIEKQYGVILME
jgi:hypothetical protein